MLKFIYFFNPFSVTFILKLDTFKLKLPSSYIIRWESQFFKLWNTIGILWFNLKVILQYLSAEPLYSPGKWQWSLSLTWPST